ncbi:hypothetical protein DPMN_086972 [Dreissena polymorpha]|uniref:Uncharacterized protein n=1 Tax=Dreissena polymorpha TaxID=45954 RepID=A0A9D4QV23_DREPO|nr:hypothetical protein DPMN_086972 [Dreissena polymorpha]
MSKDDIEMLLQSNLLCTADSNSSTGWMAVLSHCTSSFSSDDLDGDDILARPRKQSSTLLNPIPYAPCSFIESVGAILKFTAGATDWVN